MNPPSRIDLKLTSHRSRAGYFAHLPQCQLAWWPARTPSDWNGHRLLCPPASVPTGLAACVPSRDLPCLVLTHGVARAIDVGPMEVNSADKAKMSWTRTESWVQAVRNPEVGHPNKRSHARLGLGVPTQPAATGWRLRPTLTRAAPGTYPRPESRHPSSCHGLPSGRPAPHAVPDHVQPY